RVAALSAAEKRDYEELFRRCQQLVEEFFLINSLPTSTTPADSYHPSTGEPLHTCFSATSTTPLSLLRQRCVVQRGANTKALMFAWQVFFEQTRNILWPPPLIEEAAARSTKRRVCASRRNESPWEPQQ
ncbi:hypothetical protein, partial [Ralstonia solanacearum]